jgi:hypothetical protein
MLVARTRGVLVSARCLQHPVAAGCAADGSEGEDDLSAGCLLIELADADDFVDLGAAIVPIGSLHCCGPVRILRRRLRPARLR